jgi:hypothetical protein
MGGLFKGPDEKVSMMRVITAFTCLSIMLIFIAHNIVSMIKGGAFISIGASEAMLITGVIGAKAAQAFSENKKVPGKLSDSAISTEGGE